jgi:ABC-2 type transport system permease protein
MFNPSLSSADVPAGTMARALRPVAANQPFTPVIETMRGLWMGHTSTGASLGHEATLAIVYCAAILVVSAGTATWLFRHRTAGH